MSDFTRPIEYVSISKYSHGTIRERGVRLYCTASSETHGITSARYALQIFAPLQRHDGSEGRAYMIATASLSMDDLVAIRAEVDGAITEVRASLHSSRKNVK
jgi:hypothetical protein